MVGRIGRPHGVRGEVTVEVRTDDPAERFAAGRRLVTDPVERGPVRIVAAAGRSGRWVLGIDGVTDREGAEALRDTLLLVPTGELPPIEDTDEFYDHELVGLVARTTTAEDLGPVEDVLHGPAGDLLVIRRGSGAELLVPFLRAMVPTVDVPGGYLVVDPPEGLLEL